MTGDEERIDGRALLHLLLATPSGRIADALDRMSPEEQDALFGVFVRAALALEAEARGLRRRPSRRKGPARTRWGRRWRPRGRGRR